MEINFKQIVDLIISGGKDAKKCDTKDEYKSLSNLLAGHSDSITPEESLYALGLMIDYETNRAKQPPITEITQPPVEETPKEPPVEETPEEPPVEEINPPTLEEDPSPEISDIDLKDLEQDLFLMSMKDRSVNSWLNHYLSTDLGFDIDFFEDPENYYAGCKKTVDDILDKLIVNKSDLRCCLTEQPSGIIAYLVDETIAERIDKALNMDKSDVHELVIVPLINRLKEFKQTSDLSNFIKECESKNPKDMNIKQMQELINEMVKTIKNEDKKIVESIKDTAEKLANISYGVANDPRNVKLEVHKKGLDEIEYRIEYNGSIITVTKDADGKYSLGSVDEIYDKKVEDSSVWFGQRSILDDLFALIEIKLSKNEILPIKKVHRDSDGKIEWSDEYEYDANGNNTKEVRRDSDGKIEWSDEYEYDANGNKTKEVHRDSDGKIYWSYEYENEYDANGNMTKQVSRDPDGKINWSDEYEYDANGNMTKEVSRDPDGKIKWSYEYEYDANGNKTKVVHHDYNERSHWSMEYEYDAKGKITKSVYREYDADGKLINEEIT